MERLRKHLGLSLAWIALAVQFALPMVHSDALQTEIAVARDSGAVLTVAAAPTCEDDHDATTCPACHLLRSSHHLLLTAVAVNGERFVGWTDPPPSDRPFRAAPRNLAAPRAPPLLA